MFYTFCHSVLGVFLLASTSFRCRSPIPALSIWYAGGTTDIQIGCLEAVARSVHFRTPRIHLESCTSQELQSISHYRVSEHTGTPVYFHQAMQRIERHLGLRLWLEAGIDLSMATKTVAKPEDHAFQAIKTDRNQMSALTEATIGIWREGISTSYWNYVSPRAKGLRKTSLPPHRLQRTRHWFPYIDRMRGSQETILEHHEPSNLNTRDEKAGEYLINTACQHFSDSVSWPLCSHPLSPASIYLGCATMVAQTELGSFPNKALWFGDVSIQAP